MLENEYNWLLILPSILFLGETISLITCIHSPNTISVILFLLSLIINIVAIFYFLKTVNVKGFRE